MNVWKKLLFYRIDRRHGEDKKYNNDTQKKRNSGVPCTALPADIAAISTGVDWFFNHSSICFFFSVKTSPMPMLIALRAFEKINSFYELGKFLTIREKRRVLTKKD